MKDKGEGPSVNKDIIPFKKNPGRLLIKNQTHQLNKNI